MKKMSSSFDISLNLPTGGDPKRQTSNSTLPMISMLSMNSFRMGGNLSSQKGIEMLNYLNGTR
mgnify:CR=1 FL=1|tara:strand:+ start:284 stop:472 length:189 start_codon:yes stop_codon:yes gene_type:complete